MSDEEIKALYWECHNVFWKKWRSASLDRQSMEWDQVVKEAGDIMKKYHHDTMAVHMIQDLLDVLEKRMIDMEKG